MNVKNRTTRFKNGRLYEPLSLLYHGVMSIQYRARDVTRRRYRGPLSARDGYYHIEPSHPLLPEFDIRLDVTESRRNHHRSRIRGEYETSVLSTLVDVVSENTTFWEIGAKRGYFSLSLAPLTKEVVAIDATERDLEALEEASVRNGYDNISTHHTLLQEGADLNEMVDLYGAPDVALMDIEGWEEAVLQGADEFLAAKPTMVIEVHDDQQVSHTLEAAGYRVAKIKQRRLNNYHLVALPDTDANRR